MKILRPLFLGLAITAASATYAAGSLDLYQPHEYVYAQGDTLRYRLLEPESLEPGKSYPLVVFLHGAGERGSDNALQLTHGAQMWLNPVNRERYPAYVLMPQCPSDAYWAYTARPEDFTPERMPVDLEPAQITEAVIQLISRLIEDKSVDADRIYLMGLSMGGMATYDLAIRYPELFAAAVPICGTVNPSRLVAAAGVPFRIYHGDADPVVPVEGSREAYRALRVAGADVDLIEFPGVGHGSWNPAFTDPAFFPWLFSQHK
ncbi:MAG: alpha/beta fold hydrolase [Muribaculaceae bacterium]|nr:alpha/beta fold hydrolase [Muribaculaceae bacterium]